DPRRFGTGDDVHQAVDECGFQLFFGIRIERSKNGIDAVRAKTVNCFAEITGHLACDRLAADERKHGRCDLILQALESCGVDSSDDLAKRTCEGIVDARLDKRAGLAGKEVALKSFFDAAGKAFIDEIVNLAKKIFTRDKY